MLTWQTYKSVGARSFTLIGTVGHIGKYDGEGDGKDARESNSYEIRSAEKENKQLFLDKTINYTHTR